MSLVKTDDTESLAPTMIFGGEGILPPPPQLSKTLLPPLAASLEKTNDTEKSPLDATMAPGEDNLPPPPQRSETLLLPLATSLENAGDTEKSPLDATSMIFGGEDNLPPPPQLSVAEEKKLWRKVDLRLLPILALLFLVCYIDGGNFFFIRLLGLLKI